MTLGEFIRRYREENRLSQRQFAIRCKLSNGYIAMLEKNINPATGKPIVPGIKQVKLIAEAMGMTLDELIRSVDERQIISLSDGDKDPESNNGPNHVPVTSEARILSAGVDRMPEEDRKKLLQMVELMFDKYKDYFETGKEDD